MSADSREVPDRLAIDFLGAASVRITADVSQLQCPRRGRRAVATVRALEWFRKDRQERFARPCHHPAPPRTLDLTCSTSTAGPMRAGGLLSGMRPPAQCRV